MQTSHGGLIRHLNRRNFLGWMLGSMLLSATKIFAQPESNSEISLPDVVLVDSEGVEHRFLELVAEQPVALSFIFTQCSTICPVQTALFQRLQHLLLQRRTPGLLLSISLDPGHDTPQALHSYAAQFSAQLGLDRHWLMLTGEPQALADIWRVFEVKNTRPSEHSMIFWVGSVKQQRWHRLVSLPSAIQMLELLKQSHL